MNNKPLEGPLSLRKNFSWSLFGSVVGSGCRWLMLVAMAKMLDSEQVGYYTLALSITTPIMMFSMLQLRTVHVTDVRNEYPYGYYLGVRLLTNALAALVMCGVLVILTGRYDGMFYGVILLVFFNKAIESTADISYAVLQKHERLDKVAKSTMLRQGTGAAVLIGVLWLTESLLMGVIAIGICWLGVLFMYDRKNVKIFSEWKPSWNITAFKMIIFTGLPLGISRGIISLNESVPRYFIEAYLGTSTQGIFSAMVYTMTVGYLCIEVLGYSVVARLARYYIYNRQAYIRILLKVVVFALLIGLVCILLAWVAGIQLLTILYNSEYAKYHDVFTWLMVVVTGHMISSMLNHGMNAARYYNAQVPLNIIVLIVTAIFCMLLLPKYGLKGCAQAMLIGVCVKIIGSTMVILHAVKKAPTKTEK